MTAIPLVRAIHINIYLDVLREIGRPVDAILSRAGLPWALSEMPDAYLHVPQALSFISMSAHPVELMELGYLTARRATIANLRPAFQNAILGAASGFALLEVIIRHCKREDGALVAGISEEGGNIRVRCDLVGFPNSPAVAYSEWLQIQELISAVRCVAGPHWVPEEITFVSGSRLSDAALNAFGNSRILLGQPHCSILVRRELLGRPCRIPAPSPRREEAIRVDVADDPPPWNFAEAMRQVIKPYMGETPLGLAELAELLGMSERTLQRRLAEHGLNFKRLVQEARYEIASDLLADPSIRITDVAFAAGYANPQHFSRAFRRIAGMTPLDFRRSAVPGGHEERGQALGA